MIVCSRPECQTSAGCQCGRGIAMQMPQTYFTEKPTMQLRWNNGVLEQAFMRSASLGNAELVWRTIPSIGQ